jgi:hypothetical protein
MSVNFGFSLPALRQYGAAGSNPFGQLGPTLDLSFVDGATGVTDLSNPTGYTLNTNFITPEYQVAAQYAVWGANGLTQQNFADIVTFTRVSNATQFDSTGSLVYAPANLLTYSEDFGNAAWTKGGATVSTNTTTAPTGTSIADSLIEDSSTGQHRVYRSVSGTTNTNPYTVSFFAKANTRTRVYVGMAEGTTFVRQGNAVFDLSAGTVVSAGGGSGGATGGSATITAVGNGWYRCTYTLTLGGTDTTIFSDINLVSTGTTINYTGDGTSGLFLFGAQLNLSPMFGGITSSLSTYYPTTTTAYYGPRFDYNPSTLAAQGLLIEESRTNSIRNNTMQGAVAGTPGTLPTNGWAYFATAGLTTSVIGTGTQNGINYIDLRLNGTTTSTFIVLAFDSVAAAASSGQVWTESFWVSLVGGSTANITSVNVNLRQTGGATPTFDTPFTPTATFTRVAGSGTLTAGATGALAALAIFCNNGVAIDITLRIGLPQLEQGAFATSVIPTTTTALTRAADVASVNTLSPWYNATEGTLFADVALLSSSYTSGLVVDLGAGGAFGTNEYINWTGSVWALSPNIAPINVSSSVTTTSTAKVAAAIKANDSVISANGLIGATDTSCSIVSAPTTLSLGKAGWSGGANYLNGYLRRITYYPRRLSNAELQTITA